MIKHFSMSDQIPIHRLPQDAINLILPYLTVKDMGHLVLASKWGTS